MKFTIISLASALIALSAHAEEAKPASPKQAGRPALRARPAGDQAIKRTVADAMGFVRGMGQAETTKTLNRMQWSGKGQLTEGGVVYPLTRYTYTISLHLKAAREDYTRTVKGKPERSVHVFLDQDAWDEREPGVDGKLVSEMAKNRRLQLARTPFGFVRAMLDADQSTVKVVDPGPTGKVTISFAVEGAPVSATLDRDYRPETIAMTVDGREIVGRYGAYRDLSEYGVMFPTRWSESIDGHPHVNLAIDDGRVASYAVFPKPPSQTE